MSEDEFTSWVAANCRFSMGSANMYLSLAEAQAKIDKAVFDEEAASLSLADAIFHTTVHHAKDAYEREILVALQDHNFSGFMGDLAKQIKAAPRTWRWWIRSHPHHSILIRTPHWFGNGCFLDKRAPSDCEHLVRANLDQHWADGKSASMPNLVVVPSVISMHGATLETMLKKMDLLVTLTSTASKVAARHGVPAFFLKMHEVRNTQALCPLETMGSVDLINRGLGKIVEFEDLNAEIARLPARGART